MVQAKLQAESARGRLPAASWVPLFVACLAMAVAVFAVVSNRSTGAADVVRAERFLLVDPDGNEWARLGWADDGQGPGLFLADPTGQAVLSFVEANDGRTYPTLLLFDPNRVVRLAATVAPDGVWIDLSDERGRKRLSVGQQQDGAVIEGLAEDGTVVFQQRAPAPGSP